MVVNTLFKTLSQLLKKDSRYITSHLFPLVGEKSSIFLSFWHKKSQSISISTFFSPPWKNGCPPVFFSKNRVALRQFESRGCGGEASHGQGRGDHQTQDDTWRNGGFRRPWWQRLNAAFGWKVSKHTKKKTVLGEELNFWGECQRSSCWLLEGRVMVFAALFRTCMYLCMYTYIYISTRSPICSMGLEYLPSWMA